MFYHQLLLVMLLGAVIFRIFQPHQIITSDLNAPVRLKWYFILDHLGLNGFLGVPSRLFKW